MNLGNYVSVIFTASVLGAVCAAVAGSAFEHYIRYIAALVCILLIVYPFRSFSFSVPEESIPMQETVSQADSLQCLAGALAQEEISRVIADALYAQTGITAASVRIDMEWTEKEAVITAVTLVLEQKEQTETAAAWVEAVYGVPCHTVLEGGTP